MSPTFPSWEPHVMFFNLKRAVATALVALTAACSTPIQLPSFPPVPYPSKKVVEKAQNSVVRIMGTQEMNFFGEKVQANYVCSGWQVADNRVMTDEHCVGKNMVADGKPVKVLKVDPYYDLALLEVDLHRPFLTMRDEPVERFEEAVAIGYAYGWTSLTALKERVLLVNGSVDPSLPVGIVVQGGYIGGMSGGPLIDQSGMVISIIQRGSEQIGYGVPTLLIKAFLLGEEVDLGKGMGQMHTGRFNLEPIPFYLK